MKKRGFTLIELLVVIAIIAILAAILFPVFAQARDKARQAACLSNSKQMGMGIAMYTQDYDEVLPIGGRGLNAGEPGATTPNRWDKLIMPYVKNGTAGNNLRGLNGMWTCPSRTSYMRPNRINGVVETRGYGCNGNLMGWGSIPPSRPNVPSRSLAEIGSPAGTFIIAEGSSLLQAAATPGDPRNLDPETWPQFEDRRSDWQIVAPGAWNHNRNANYLRSPDRSCNSCRRPMARHGKGANIIYADGHAKWHNIKQFLGISPQNPKGWPYGHANNTWDNI